MKSKNLKKAFGADILLVLVAAVAFIMFAPKSLMAKSLYVIADIKGASEDGTLPVQAYDIEFDGTLTFQAQHNIPHRMLGAVGMAIDTDSGYVFITYEASNEIQLIEAKTMTDAGTTLAPDATDLAGIVYDHQKGLLYCVDRGTSSLYVYNWQPQITTLNHVSGSPFRLRNASAYGIALDDINDLLYVANASNTITVYTTSDWSLVNTITLGRIAISIAIDVNNGFVYTGGGYAGNTFLTQYHLSTGTEAEVQVEADAGVMGLGVDTDTGLVYMSTGRNTEPGGDNLLVYDKALNQIDIVTAIGNPTGLAIPGKDIGYNPLNLKKQVLRGAIEGSGDDEIKTVSPGDTYTYGIYFDNNNSYAVTDVTIIDILPDDVTFVSADENGVNGYYVFDEVAKKHTYFWSYEEFPPRSSKLLELTVQVNPDIDAGTIITNSVTIGTNETPSTTTSVSVVTTSNTLNLKQRILGFPEGQLAQVSANDIITYTIDLDNIDNDFEVTNVSVIDEFPKDVTFIKADNINANGNYDDTAHTYTWTFDSLKPGAIVHLELEVSVNSDLALSTMITNSVTINSNETPPSTASIDAVVYYKPLNITKRAVDSTGSEIDWIEPGQSFIYQICFDNNNNDSEVTDVLLSDTLPSEITFASAQVDNRNFTGHYDLQKHSFTGVLKSLEPGLATCLEITVKVNQDTPPGTIITNSAIIVGNETPQVTANTNVITREIPTGKTWDYISEIYIEQIWDYGDPTDDNDLTYEFYMKILSFDETAMNMDSDVVGIGFLTPAGNTFQIPKLSGRLLNSIWTSYKYEREPEGRYAAWEYKARFRDLTDLQAYGDGEYTIILYQTDGNQSQTTAWFGIPNTKQAIPQPTQEPVLTFPLQRQTVKSPVTFSWEYCLDPNVEDIYIDVNELGTIWLGGKWKDFDKIDSSWGPVYLPDGFWETEMVFSPRSQWDYNNDGIWISASKYIRSRYRFTVEDSPWTMYEVWGGDKWIDWTEGDYGRIANLEANGYVNLGKSNGQTETFSGQYRFYLIATVGEFLLDSIQGSDRSYLSSYELSGEWESSNISDDDNILGPPDGRCATVGVSNPWSDYSGYFVFSNPGNWEGLTVITSDLNLNLRKEVVGTVDEIQNIDPNDTITYRISFDSNDFSQNVTDVTVVDILPYQVSFVSADSNEVSGTYDPSTHTYTWLYPTLAPESAIENRLTVKVNPDITPGMTITNSVTINSNETPPSTASVDAATSYKPLDITKKAVDSSGSEIDWIEPGQSFIYQICFYNNNDSGVTDVLLSDTLPSEVTFISVQVDNGNFEGHYDLEKHSFTGVLRSLGPGLATCLEIIVEVSQDTALGTIISNSAIINSNETPASTAGIDTVVSYKSLNITKKAVDSSGSEIDLIEPGQSFIYQICFDNNNNDSKVTDVLLSDTLPSEVNFVDVQNDNGNFIGYYDPNEHSFTGVLRSLEPGLATCLEITVKVNQDTLPGTIINNSVTIKSNETPPLTTSVDVEVNEPVIEIPPPIKVDLSITPDVLRRNGTGQYITAIVQFPEGIKKSDIDQDDRPELYYLDRNTEEFIEKGSHPDISGTENRPKTSISFNRSKLMDTLYGYGEFKLRVKGKLKSGGTYYGDDIITVSRFAGD